MSYNKSPNIVFIVLDSARRDLFGCYGNKKGLTPFLDSLAEKSLVMDDHYASGCGSAQAHVSLFLGQHSSRHGVVHNMSEMKEDVVALPKLLKRAGYKTYGHCMASFIPPAGYEDLFGFDEFYYPGKSGTTVKRGLKAAVLDRLRRHPVLWSGAKSIYRKFKSQEEITRASAKSLDGGASLEYIYKKLSNNKNNNPVFAYTTLLHPHTPYAPPQWCIDKVFGDNKVDPMAYEIQADMHAWVNGDMGECESGINSLKLLYEAEMVYADYLVGEFVKRLSEESILKDTVLVITSDHGEMFGEHKQLNHGATVWEEIYRLPLIIYSDKHFKSGIRYEELSSGLDICPTILDLSGCLEKASSETTFDGISLLKEDDRDTGRMLVVDAPPLVLPERLKKYPKLLMLGSVFYRAVRSKNYKYIWSSNGKRYLYKVDECEAENNNLINTNKAIANDMHAYMVDYYKKINPEYDINAYPINMGATAAMKMTNPVIQKELKKLGYM